MARKSAGILMFRRIGGETEVLLGHPGGPYWTSRDDGAWSIPKGEFDSTEQPLDAARREFQEETGFSANGDFIKLKPQRQKSGKVVHAFAIEGDCDASAILSNTFAMEWPRGSGKIGQYPEIDRAAWFTLDSARIKILPGQAPFLDELESILGDQYRLGEP